VDRGDPETGGEDAVVRGGRAAALNVAEDDGARLEPGATLDLALQLLPDPAQPDMAELVLPGRERLHRPLLRHRPLRDDHDREEASARVAAANEPADVV